MNKTIRYLLVLLCTLTTMPHCSKRRTRKKISQQHKTQAKKSIRTREKKKAALAKSGMPKAAAPLTGKLAATYNKPYKKKAQALNLSEQTKGILPMMQPKHKKSIKAHMPPAQKYKKRKPIVDAHKSHITNKQNIKKLVHKKAVLKQQTPPLEEETKEIDFKVKNTTGKTLYVTCFAYLRKRVHSRWRWRKSPVYKIDHQQTVLIDLPTVLDKQDRNNIFGSLGVFNNYQDAQDATYELTPDHSKLDLDLMTKLNGKKVVIETERYGFKDPFYEYDFVNVKEELTALRGKTPELDFLVVNKTNKPLYLCGFVYMKKAKGRWIAAVEDKDDMSIWRYDKTPVLRVEHGQTAYIDVDTIVPKRDRSYCLGHLAVFDESEKKLAHAATYEVLKTKHKISLGNLKRLAQRKIILEVEQYGIQGNLIDYIVKPTQKIDWKRAIR